MKKRLLRHLTIGIAALVFAGYFAFSTLLFSPIEGDYAADLSTLVPDQVDFFVAKARLGEDFSSFPELDVAARVAPTKAWRTLERSPEYADFLAEHRIAELQAEIERQLAQLPGLPGLEVPHVFGAEDLALAGRFAGPTLADADWVVFGRVNFWGKLGASLARHPGWIGLERQGLAAHVEDEHVTLEGGALARPLHVTRVRDVVAVGTSQDIVAGVRELAVRGGQQSFGQSARYFDNIQNTILERDDDEIELFVKTRALLENLQVSGRWPDPEAQDFMPAFLGKLFQLGSLYEITGIVNFDTGLQAELRADLSSELMTPVQSRLYRAKGFEQRDLLDAAKLATADTGFFAFAATDLGELLRQVFLSLEEASRELIEDGLASTGRYQDAEQLIGELDATLRDRVAILVRPNDFKYKYEGPLEEQDPPHDGAPVPAVAVVFWTNGDEKARAQIAEFQNVIAAHQAKLGIEGRNPGDKGVFRNTLTGGYLVWEFWSKQIPGTGHLSAGEAGDLYVISNSYRMVENVIFTYYGTGGQLAEAPPFRALVSSSLPQANAAVWINPRQLAPIRRELAVLQAENEVRAGVVWEEERPRMERQVLAERYDGKGRSQLAPGEQQELDAIVSNRLEEWFQEQLATQEPLIRARLERQVIYSEAVAAIFAMLATDPRSLALSVRAIVPLDEASAPLEQ